MPEETKSGIESPAGYNGKAPKSLGVPVKEYPDSSKIGRTHVKVIEGPAQGANYNRSRKGK